MNVTTRFLSAIALTSLASFAWGEQTTQAPAASTPVTPPEVTQATEQSPVADQPQAATGDQAAADPVAGGEKKPSTTSDLMDQVTAQRQASAQGEKQEPGVQSRKMLPRNRAGYESIRRQSEQMREAMRDYREQKKRAMQARHRWINPRGEYRKDLSDARRRAMRAQQYEAQRQQMEQARKQPQQWMYEQPPSGWNNPWYYRGY